MNRPTMAKSLAELIEHRFSRRRFLRNTLLTGAAASATVACSPLAGKSTQDVGQASFKFDEIEHGFGAEMHVANGHKADVLIRWGDPLRPGLPVFKPENMDANEQEVRFGYNNDYVGYLPLSADEGQQRGLLCVNHEYALPELMFADGVADSGERLQQQVAIEQAAVGNSIVEVRLNNGRWHYVHDSPYNRRINARSTSISFSGPAAGHDRLKTRYDNTGRQVIGTLMNCAGGMTPWGTYLTCEENFDSVFGGELAPDHPEQQNYQRLGIGGKASRWSQADSRFDLAHNPNEANRFGWVVEIDPQDPHSTPVKRTALGRFQHEGAETMVRADGRLVVYMGDDNGFEYIYKFVSRDVVDRNNASANKNLLDYGTLYVARLEASGALHWATLQYGTGPLTPENGFYSQADVVLEARRAADLLQATPMDRPEDIVPDERSGKVYVMLSNNIRREETDAANPRANNRFGHIVELIEDDQGGAARWEMLIRGGNPDIAAHQADFNRHTTSNGWFTCPDNGVVDPLGRLWVSTDQGLSVSRETGTNDGLWAMYTTGEKRGLSRMFFRCPDGAEVTGPMFTPDAASLFIAIQHPGEPGKEQLDPYHNPLNRWPDFNAAMPPRPAIVVVRRINGDVIA